jgi:hypothetical protein
MAQRLQQKRSSIPGRRPDNSYLNPGELAVNTNAGDPGLFFEGHDGSIIKAGPTSMGPEAPVTEVGYGNGEAWFNTGTQILSNYDANSDTWIKTLSPLFGGSEHLVFVGSEFPQASDSLDNDGSARPFASFNRACIEVARRSILLGRSDEVKQAKYTIVLLPGTNIAHNEPGLGMQDFIETVGRLTKDQELSLSDLRSFNPIEGGIPLPRGTSIIGLDPYKSNIRPTYYPEWSRDRFESEGALAPRTGVFHTTGDSLIERVTFRDKVKEITVTNISGEQDEVAILKTLEPHGLKALLFGEDGQVASGDMIRLEYPDLVARVNNGEQSIDEGLYWAEPLTETTLRIRERINLEAILRLQLPGSPSPGSVPNEFANLIVQSKTHHRLSAVKFASEAILNEYYTKVQRAFSNLNFGGVVDDTEVNDAEVNIVVNLSSVADISVDDTDHYPPTLVDCHLKSNYGMCGVTADGDLVGGLKEYFVENFNFQSLQNDPEVLDIFYDQHWIPLKEATWRGLGLEEIDVTDELALQYLVNNVQLENLRYHYQFAKDIEGKDDQSSGLPDVESDTRHYAILAINTAVVDAINQKSLGAAVGFWAQRGGRLLLEDGSISLGSEAIRSEGFTGIGTTGGALEAKKGFEVAGIRRPSVVPHTELTNPDNHEFIYLNASIERITDSQITFKKPINLYSLLPYTLREDSVIWVSSLQTGNTHTAKIVSPGLSPDGLTLAVDDVTNEMNGLDVDHLSLPYIRRFVDPRDPSQRNYYLKVVNTTESHEPPTSGNVLRFAENQGTRVNALLEPGRQLDPGLNGGWNHLFTVHQSLNNENGNNPNFSKRWNSVPERSESYYVSLNLSDSYKPWASSDDLSRGSTITYSNRAWTAQYHSFPDSPYLPSEAKSAWDLSHRSDILQSVAEAHKPTSYAKTEDPDVNRYTPADMYARGIKCPEEVYDDKVIIDYDDGTANLGIADSNQVLTSLLDPESSHSRKAIKRFLTILGYNDDTLNTFLQPQLWSNRDLPVDQLPALDGEGYALSVGNWPLEFNLASTIHATNTVWELAGNHNVSKGANQYRSSTLSRQMRFNAMRSTAWGGYVIAEGQNQLGEKLPIEVDDSRNTSNIF